MDNLYIFFILLANRNSVSSAQKKKKLDDLETYFQTWLLDTDDKTKRDYRKKNKKRWYNLGSVKYKRRASNTRCCASPCRYSRAYRCIQNTVAKFSSSN